MNGNDSHFEKLVSTVLPFVRCAIVVPDDAARRWNRPARRSARNLLRRSVTSVAALAHGIFYAIGVKANVLFMENKPAQEKPWTKKDVCIKMRQK